MRVPNNSNGPNEGGAPLPPQRNHSAPNSRAHRRPNSPAQRAALVVLPKEGCDLPVPKIPAGRQWSRTEKARWKELWQSPQATQWDETASGTVALLVAYETKLLADEGSAWVAQEARHASDALGLTPRAMAALGWTVGE
ncbi:phage terminase small subunit [Rhodococcus aetherivorans]|uniref:phage terminase small subunit n=1 Tax=Rhodococcus aetherivorans TaxID=191292 RepID=UPI00406B92D6